MGVGGAAGGQQAAQGGRQQGGRWSWAWGGRGGYQGVRTLSLCELFHVKEQLGEAHDSFLEEELKKTVCLFDIFVMGLDLRIES